MSAVSEIPVTLHLTRDAHARLSQRAAASGQDLSAYVSNLVQSAVAAPRTLEQISAPIYQRFLESGTTDDELSDELERAKHEMRADRRSREAK